MKKEPKIRTGEDEKMHFRSDRVVVMNGKYFFMTRENTQEGPFDSRLDAERELNLYIRHMNDPNQIIKQNKDNNK
jgi:hypothetical protein